MADDGYLDAPASRRDLAQLEQKVNERFDEVNGRFNEVNGRIDEVNGRVNEVNGRLNEMEDRLIEQMRKMQTELLRGFAAFSESMTIRLRKLEADQSNLDFSLSGRVAVLERRLLEIEQHLHIPPPQ